MQIQQISDRRQTHFSTSHFILLNDEALFSGGKRASSTEAIHDIHGLFVCKYDL
jgi:hypothetical protein